MEPDPEDFTTLYKRSYRTILRYIYQRVNDHALAEDLTAETYARALELQERLVEARKEERIDDTLLLLSHPHVITLGRATSDQFLRYPRRELEARGYPVMAAGRGGEITYHGPGQRVCYAIMDLNVRGCDIRQYVRDLEEWIIVTLAAFGVKGERREGRVGIWVERSIEGEPIVREAWTSRRRVIPSCPHSGRPQTKGPTTSAMSWPN